MEDHPRTVTHRQFKKTLLYIYIHISGGKAGCIMYKIPSPHHKQRSSLVASFVKPVS
jgi:hypothetical protein